MLNIKIVPDKVYNKMVKDLGTKVLFRNVTLCPGVEMEGIEEGVRNGYLVTVSLSASERFIQAVASIHISIQFTRNL